MKAPTPRHGASRPPASRRWAGAVLLWLAAALIAPMGGATFTCTPQDATCTALGALYTATGGASWTQNSGWASAAAGTATSYCSFFNVSCTGGNVLSVVLASNGLVGTMPAELAALTTLTALTLSGNTLSGTVPASLLTQIAAPKVVLYPQTAGSVLEAKTLSVSALTDITATLSSVAPADALVTTFVLQSHISAAMAQGITVPSTRKAPLVISGNTAACLSTAHDTPSPPPPPPSPMMPPGGGGGGGGPPGSPGNAAPSPTGRQSWQYVSLYTMCTIDMGGYGAVSAHITVAGATTVVIRGVSLVGGGGSTGGAVFVNSSSAALILSGAQLSYNSASGNGGAVYSLASVTATDSSFVSNAATAAGGAVFLADSSPTPGQPPSSAVLSLSNCSLTGNAAGVSHGGVVVIGGTNSLVASSTTFSLNTAAQDSGAVFVSGGVATLTSCLFDSNYVSDSSPQASTKAQMGGAVYARGGNTTLSGCTLRNNSVGGFGGAIRADGVILVISDSTITANSAGFNGGAIYATQSTSVFSNTRLADNTAQAGGGFGMSGGSVSMTSVVLSNNSVSSSSSQGGCLFADDDQAAYDAPAMLLVNTSVTGCVVTTERPVLDTPGQQYVAGYGAGSGGGIYMVGQRATIGQLVLTSGTRFAGNNATSGAGIFTYGAISVSISGSSFSANTATDMGGALYIQSAALTAMPPSGRRRLQAPTLTALLATASITGSTFSGNSATNGGVAVLNSGSTLTASASAFRGNKATNGAVLMLRVLDQDGPAPVVSLSGINATGNSAFSGALAYHDSDSALTLPTCTGCVLNNTQTNAGAAPTTFNTSLAVLVAPSGRTLPAFTVTVYDINGEPVASWPDLVITVSPGDFTGLSGTVTAAYIAGAATFDALSVSDVENANHTLTYTLSTTLTTLNGATGTVVAVVAPCEANQVFDDGTLRCKCSAGTYLVGTSCTTCPRGLVATSAGATECAVCLAREAWVNASACAACPANSVTSPYDATVCACDYGYYDTLYGVSATEPVCKACPVGGSCTTGFVAAAEGYWRESLLSDVLYVCRTGNCLEESVIGPLSKPDDSNARAWVQLSGNLTAFNASAAVVSADGDTAPQNCVEGNAGPLCALCLPGYAMQSGACAVCDPKDAFDNWEPGTKTGMLVGCIVFALIFIAFAFFQPLVPALEVAADAVMARVTAMPGKLKACITCACCACCRPKATPPPPPKPVAEESDDVPLAPLAQGDGEGKPHARSSANSDFDADTHAVGAKPRRSEALVAVAQAEPQAARTSTGRAGRTSSSHAARTSAGGHHASHPHHRHFEERQVYGVVHADATMAAQVQTNAAFAMGSMAAFTGDDGGDDEGGGGGMNISGVEGQLDFMDMLEELIEKLQKMSKIIVNFYQIVSTFLKSLDVPWPAAFGSVMSRVNVINLNLVQLPKAACMNPTVDYYKSFNGYTLGMVGGMLTMVSIWGLGVHVVGPLFLRRLPESERVDRLARFSSLVLSRALLLLYLVYPGVSVSIFSMFSCTTLESGVSYLDADFNIVCYDALHWRYIGAAIAWLFVVPIGVPAFFIWLLRRFKVPRMAQLKTENAWLREIVKLGWQDGLAQPGDLDAAAVSVDDIADMHLEALYAYFLHEATDEEAAEILSGVRPGFVEPPPAEAPEPTGLLAPLLRAASAARAWAAAAVARLRTPPVHASAAVARRAHLLASLLAWAPTSGRVSTPPVVQWEEPGGEPEEEESDGKEEPAAADESAEAVKPQAVVTPPPPDPNRVLTKELPALQERALKECGFLFAAYHSQCWYWETVELLRKLALTSILALIATGSAGQVVVGLLIAFAALLLNLHYKPFADDTLNTVNTLAQLNLFFVLFVALLLKVDLDGSGSSSFFSFVVGALTIVPIALPVLLKLYIKLYGGLEARMLANDSAWD